MSTRGEYAGAIAFLLGKAFTGRAKSKAEEELVEELPIDEMATVSG